MPNTDDGLEAGICFSKLREGFRRVWVVCMRIKDAVSDEDMQHFSINLLLFCEDRQGLLVFETFKNIGFDQGPQELPVNSVT